LRQSTIAARVVVLPQPVAPTRMHRWQAHAVDGGHAVRYHPYDQADLALLQEGVHPEAANAGRRNRKVAFLGAFEFCGLLIAHDGAGQRHGVGRSERLGGDLGDAAIDFDARREIRSQEQVAAIAADH